jgi:hypothetical protein
MTAVGKSNPGGRMRLRMPLWILVMAGVMAMSACGTGGAAASPAAQAPDGQPRAAAADPDLDPGTSLGGTSAPGFRLVNQFGQPMSLSQSRGKVVILAFTDSQCTTICPLTTVSMIEAKELLGAAGARVQLLGVDAKPRGHVGERRNGLLPGPWHGQPVGLPDRDDLVTSATRTPGSRTADAAPPSRVSQARRKTPLASYLVAGKPCNRPRAGGPRRAG